MQTLLPALVVIVVALLGARVSFSAASRRLGPRLLFGTGTHFVLVGFALGPSGLGLLTGEATEGLFPLLALGLGWVGFHFGLQLDRRLLEQFPLRQHVFAFGQAAIAFLVFAAGALAATRVAGLEGSLPVLLALGAACTAAVTTPAGIAMVSSHFEARGRVRDLVYFTGSVDALVGVVALQVTYALFRPDAVAAGLGPDPQLVFVGLALGLALLCGIVFLWLTRARPVSEELVLFVLGACAFASGLALQWNLSPLFVSVGMGAVVANFSRSADRVQLLLSRWEKPVYVTFLLIAGALLEIPTWLVFPIVLGYVGLRFLAKLVGAGVMASLVRFDFDVPRRLGLGLIPQGGISIAMAVSAVLMYSDIRLRGIDVEALLFAVIVMGVALSELSGPFLTMRLLRRAGEIPAAGTTGAQSD